VVIVSAVIFSGIIPALSSFHDTAVADVVVVVVMVEEIGGAHGRRRGGRGNFTSSSVLKKHQTLHHFGGINFTLSLALISTQLSNFFLSLFPSKDSFTIFLNSFFHNICDEVETA